MVSSVRRGGLGEVRDAIRPVLDILGYEPMRFEDFTPQPVPPRAVCVDAVKRADIYLLLLGEEYGDPLPETGLAPTAEEWSVARERGKPIVVFKKAAMMPEQRQAEFIAEVESYSTGMFRGTFTDTAELLGKLKDAIATAAATIQPMQPRRLAEPVVVPWRTEVGGLSATEVIFETHVVPVVSVDPIRTVTFPELSRRLARAGRDHGLFDEGDALAFPMTEFGVAAQSEGGRRRAEAGLRITTDRSISVWEALPSAIGATVFDERQLAIRIARDIRVAAALELLTHGEVAVAIGLNRVDMLARPSGPNAMSFPFFGTGGGPIRLEPLDAVSVAVLPRIADEIAADLVSRLSLRLQAGR